MKKYLNLMLLLVTSPVIAAPVTYQIDNQHSFANFSVRHVVSKTSGTFSNITGEIKIDPTQLANASVNAKIDMNSVNTSLAKRDEHIKAPKYLDVLNFGEMTFVSHKIEATTNTEGVMHGDLSLHGVTKAMAIPFKVLGFGADPWGGERSGFEAHTTIKASDFGFNWMKGENAPVGDEISVTLLIEGTKAK